MRKALNTQKLKGVSVLPTLQQAGGDIVFEKHIGVPLWPFMVFVVAHKLLERNGLMAGHIFYRICHFFSVALDYGVIQTYHEVNNEWWKLQPCHGHLQRRD